MGHSTVGLQERQGPEPETSVPDPETAHLNAGRHTLLSAKSVFTDTGPGPPRPLYDLRRDFNYKKSPQLES